MNKEKDIKTEFKPYRNFINEEQLNIFLDLLKDGNIEYKIQENDTIIDKIIVGFPMKPKYEVQVKLEDIDNVDKLILNNPISIEEIENHYLNKLNNKELHDILLNSKEWSIEAVQTAEIILKSRNYDIDYDAVEKSKKEDIHNNKIGKKEPIYKILIYASFIAIGFFLHKIFIFLNIILIVAGLGMGYYYAFGKKYDKKGDKYFVYDAQTRFLGKLLFFGGILVLLLEFIFLMSNRMYY